MNSCSHAVFTSVIFETRSTIDVKDNFSKQSGHYVKFRPHYPASLFDFISALCSEHIQAWDVATGNGQAAAILANYFETVQATDISAQQLQHAISKPNIVYSLESAEQASFLHNSFDVITVAQAIHWLRFDDFYKQVYRVLKPGGIFVVIGYPLFSVDRQTDEIITRLYKQTLAEYWDPERKYIDELYAGIPFPFDEIKCPTFQMEYLWTLDHLIGFLNSWSAVQHFITLNQTNPVEKVQSELASFWKRSEKKKVHFPLIIRLGKKQTV